MERCNGCGACLEACPDGAIYLVDDRAVVDNALCRECEACVTVCPTEAISFASPESYPVAESIRVPARRPESDVVQVRTLPTAVSLRSRVLPMVGASLAWLGSEIVPLLANYFLDSLDRQVARREATAIAQRTSDRDAQTGRGEGGRRHRRRRGN